ncbi:MAG: Tol-Pal system beta propeller repeat protein TolB, partial [Candidatus Vecturithrix sp.]|nr:Tol-Pal system beta propeller repeat protein TolB [Candidatus Vecturithrix sp.]
MQNAKFEQQKRWLWLLWVGSLMWSSSVLATEVSVEITGSGRHLIKIAVTPFVAQPVSSDQMQAELAAILQNDLRISGFFETLDADRERIQRVHASDLASGEVQFQQWADLGARLLVKGLYERQGDKLRIECRVYDTLGGDFILGKRYESDIAHTRRVIHRLADEIILKMTGESGMSSSRLVFTSNRTGGRELYQIDFDGANLTRLTEDRSLVISPAVSPDGQKICYTSYKENNPDLYLMSVEDRKTEILAMHPGLNFAAAWASDNQTLVLTLSKDGNPELYLLDILSRQETRLTQNQWNDVSPAWSPDSSEIVYTADNIGAPQLYIMNRTGGNLRRLTFRGAYNVSPAWSPTGEAIAFTSSMDGNFNIYTVHPNGDNLQQLTQNFGNNEEPAWSPDGRYLAFQSTR